MVRNATCHFFLMDSQSEHVFEVTSDPPIRQLRRNFTPRIPVIPPMDRNVIDQPILIFYRPRDRFGRPYHNQVKLFTVADTEADFVDFLQTFIQTQNMNIENLIHPREVYDQVVGGTFERQNQNRANMYYHRNFMFRLPQTAKHLSLIHI